MGKHINFVRRRRENFHGSEPLYKGKRVGFARRRRENFGDFRVVYKGNTLILRAAGEKFWSDFLGYHESGSYPPPLCFKFWWGKGGDNYLDIS